MICLIPPVVGMQIRPGELFVGQLTTIQLPAPVDAALLGLATTLADELQALGGRRPRIVPAGCAVCGPVLTLRCDRSLAHAEAYRLTVAPEGVAIDGGSEAGCFYALQTFRQLLRGEGAVLPALTIEDAPAYAVRGFYHDCTRSRVPTLDTLKQLADKLAYYKINQLQLYVEHTFAFAGHSDLWAGSDPLTAEDILVLDAYCRERHIDLVPSLSTFGHFYMALRSKRKEHLNELELNASELPFSYQDRMGHYTLDCLNPESLQLVAEMIGEFAPLFRSKLFNICCDETFDLGKGRNQAQAAAVGAGQLYVTFLKQIMQLVQSHGKQPMFWGDVILTHPEYIDELPKDAIALDWDYSAAAANNDTGRFRAAGMPFYVCPGVAGWSQCIADIETASANITNYALKGQKFGATGLLNTDWGDYGHINLLGTSFHGMALGAAAGWNPAAAADLASFDRAFEVLELGLRTGDFCALWREFNRATVSGWWHLNNYFDPAIAPGSDMRKWADQLPTEKLLAAIPKLEALLPRLTAALATAAPLDAGEKAELLSGFRGQLLMNQALLALRGAAGVSPWRIADELRAFERDFCTLWLRRNHAAEYYRFRTLWLRVAEALDVLGRRS